MADSSWLDGRLTHAEFATMIGVTRQAVSEMVGSGFLVADETGRGWLLAYCKRLRDKAAGRDSDSNLSRERARLSRAQAELAEAKLARERGEYAPIAVLAEVMATASQSVVDRFDMLPATLRTAAPDLPAAACDALMRLIAGARNEWVRATTEQLVERLLGGTLSEADDHAADDLGEPEAGQP